ncbi:MAG: hypothetical protein AAGH53_00145 [Pseudomonadota bacterium]
MPLLKIAYAANILILVPVCYSMFFGSGVGSVFEGHVVESAGLRLLVGSLWAAILLASAAGLVYPAFFAPVLLIQIVYKALWLGIFVLPLIIAGDPWPRGISYCFLAIIVTYPLLFWFGYMRAA